MMREPQDSTNHIFTDVMSGRNGTIIVVIVTIICAIAAYFAVFTAWQVHNNVKAVEAYQNEAYNNEHPGTEPPENDSPGTKPLETKPLETKPPETKPLETKPPETEPPETKPPETEPPEPDRNVIIVDAGHGYDDPGTGAKFLDEWVEKDITLDIALKLGALLEEENCEVYYTRKDDIIPKNAPRNAEGLYLLNAYAREDFIKSIENVDAVVSIHCDSFEKDPGVNGVRIFYYKNNSNTIAFLAENILTAITEMFGIKDKPHLTPPFIDGLTKENAFYITKCTDIPSVLIETGFVTNKTDAANFLIEKWRQDMAQGIADGVLRFLGAKFK